MRETVLRVRAAYRVLRYGYSLVSIYPTPHPPLDREILKVIR